jgi:hypothetical protein
VTNYRLHTGRELEMMLSGLKPLAMFYGGVDPDERIVPEKQFSPYVDSGEFVKKEFVVKLAQDPRTNKPVEVRYVLYSIQSEQWRIDAMRLAIKTMIDMGGADEGLDRMMGFLLGDASEEIEKFVERNGQLYKNHALTRYRD